MHKEIDYQWRITKYNPSYRNAEGHYLRDEWTSVSEIGKSFQGAILTLNDYLQVEKAYVDTVMKFLEVYQIENVRLIHLETYGLSNVDKTSPLYDPLFDTIPLAEDMLVTIDQIPIVCKMALREFIHCQMITEDFFVHLGDDYYLFIGATSIKQEAIQFASEQRLFVEQMISPYYLSEKNVIREVAWSFPGERIIEDSEILTDISLEELQNIFQLSSIHPVTGSYLITKDNAKFFQKKIKHKMDFSKYEYYLLAGS
ncbi:hypothetical protein ACIP9C_01155 [Lysinibacillus sp. NPDC093210]|uniref:DUF7683 domain-containing protein n=1 Tax=Lysinibacillus sp. NPDC093210 TaxID=3364133 RepID=UPI00382E9D5A